MLLDDCQIISDDMLLTLSHLHVALYIVSLATAPWRRAYQDSLSPPAQSEWGGTECLQGAITALAQRAPSQPCHVDSVLLHLFPSLTLSFSGRWCTHRKSLAVYIRSPNALCQLAVPAVIFLLTSLLCGRELPAPAFLKACHGLQAQEAGKRKCIKATLIC